MYSRIDSSLGLMPVDNSMNPTVMYQDPLEPPHWHGKPGQVFADSQNNLWIYDKKYSSWLLTGCVKLTCLGDEKGPSLAVEGHGLTISLGCRHEWKTYNGFTDQFEYCGKCNEKRS